jgi:MlaD protein
VRWLTRLTTAAVIAIVVAGVALGIRAGMPTTRVGGEFRTYAMFRDASRLAVGAAVVIASVQVGVIEKLTVEGDLARVDLRRGAVLPGWSAAIEGIAVPIDQQRQFTAKVGAPSGRALAIRFSHPRHGVHYYLRRSQ